MKHLTMPWIAAALSTDLPPSTAMPTHCGSVEVALWRSGSGALRAWHDRCPHRGMRLSHGFVRGETLSCLYHGWRYDGSGQCRAIPAHPALKPPATIRTNPLAVMERDGVIWLAAATAENTGCLPPTLTEGLAPLRSLTVDAPLASVSSHLRTVDTSVALRTVRAETAAGQAGVRDPSDPIALAGSNLTLLLQPLPKNSRIAERTTLHALTTATGATELTAASRDLETLRRSIETLETA